MIKSYRTKRRKIQEEISLLTNNNNHTIILNVSLNTANNDQLYNSTISSRPKLISNNLNSSNDNINNSNNNIIKSNLCTNNDAKIPLKNKIANWTVECNVPHTTINKLLKILKEKDFLPLKQLPSDSRTLLNTKPIITTNIKKSKSWYILPFWVGKWYY